MSTKVRRRLSLRDSRTHAHQHHRTHALEHVRTEALQVAITLISIGADAPPLGATTIRLA